MNTTQRRRFLKLIRFLEKIEPEKFYLGSVVHKYDVENKCGTVCCAIGWTPRVFPSLIKWSIFLEEEIVGSYFKVTNNNDKLDWMDAAKYLFGINYIYALQLFGTTDYPLKTYWGALEHRNDATPIQVAASMSAYLQYHDKKMKSIP